MTNIEIQCEQVADGLFNLFHQKNWLNTPGGYREGDELRQSEALRFLLEFASNPDAQNGWKDTSPQAQRVVHTLLTDFMTKLMVSGGPYHRVRWDVPASIPLWHQALWVLAYEIKRSHPSAVRPQ